MWAESFPSRPFPWTPDPFPAEELLTVFDRHGVAGGVDVTPIMYGDDNTYGLRAAAAQPQRLRVFGRFDPLAPDPYVRLRRWMDNDDAAGVRLTFYGADLRQLDEPDALEPFWSAAEALGVRVAVFAPDALWSIVRVTERHPTLRLIIDHLGLGVYPGCSAPFANHDALARFAPFPDVLVKVSGAVEVSAEPFPFRDVQQTVLEANEVFGAHRLMWGSNYPVVRAACSYGEALGFVDECGFTTPERADILGGTCLRMLAEALRRTPGA